jgi:hypothetical protein
MTKAVELYAAEKLLRDNGYIVINPDQPPSQAQSLDIDAAAALLREKGYTAQ